MQKGFHVQKSLIYFIGCVIKRNDRCYPYFFLGSLFKVTLPENIMKKKKKKKYRVHKGSYDIFKINK